jgi:membrane protein insertase, YidC/Oxa1 family, C-terminal domain
MDRNTIIAVVLSVIVITVGMTLQTVFFAPEVPDTTTVEAIDSTAVAADNASSQGSATPAFAGSFVPIGKDEKASTFIVENEVMSITFDTAGASVSSIKLKDHLDQGQPVDVLFKTEDMDNAFLLYVGAYPNKPLKEVYAYNIEDKGDITRVSFARDYQSVDGKPFTIVKEYGISNKDEYLFQMAVTIRTPDGSVIPLNTDGYMYSVGIGPQVGPEFQVLSNYDYRRVYYKLESKGSKKVVSYNKNGDFSYNDKAIDWVALSSKYFTMMCIPGSSNDYKFVSTIKTGLEGEVPQENILLMARPAAVNNQVTDVYSFYCGPQLTSALNRYDLAKDNVFGLKEQHLNKVIDSSSWLGWLEYILKFILTFFYRLIPNYGVAIILLTILIKLLLQPMSKKGMESTAKMSALQPKLTELQERYKDQPEQLNAAMAKLYKDEGINPMGSCLPMLIQFPIFIALYGLLQKHFELRGAMFIPGWIPDLSIPDTVFTFPFSIPFLGPQLHLLPIIYTASMIFSMKITQTGTTQGQGAGMMKFMTYGMPIMFFFVMYNAPSGLLVYWTVMNFISIGQQVFVNKKKKGQFESELKAREEEKKKVRKFKKK